MVYAKSNQYKKIKRRKSKMKKGYNIPLILFVLLVGVSPLFAQDFRQTTWGMTKSQVRATRKPELISGRHVDTSQPDGFEYTPSKGGLSTLSREDRVVEFDCSIIYTLIKNRLIMGTYLFNINHINPNKYINDYYTLKKLLIKKYGKPLPQDEMIWLYDVYKDKPYDWGLAVEKGHLKYVTEWDTPKTKIKLLYCENLITNVKGLEAKSTGYFSSFLGFSFGRTTITPSTTGGTICVIYTSKKLEHLIDEAKKEAELEYIKDL
jgi:hypothetical protein